MRSHKWWNGLSWRQPHSKMEGGHRSYNGNVWWKHLHNNTSSYSMCVVGGREVGRIVIKPKSEWQSEWQEGWHIDPHTHERGLPWMSRIAMLAYGFTNVDRGGHEMLNKAMRGNREPGSSPPPLPPLRQATPLGMTHTHLHLPPQK